MLLRKAIAAAEWGDPYDSQRSPPWYEGAEADFDSSTQAAVLRNIVAQKKMEMRL